MNNRYHMDFSESQDYIRKRGFDIPWYDDEVFVDRSELTRTVGNILKWADEHPIHEQISIDEMYRRLEEKLTNTFGVYEAHHFLKDFHETMNK